MQEAMFYEKVKNGVKCALCPHFCIILEGKSGVCGVRKNIDGILYSLVYEKVIAAHVDPVEKKPLFHFLPGSRIYSYATAGCNLRCQFCQNWDISQISKGEHGQIIGENMSAKEVVMQALAMKCESIAMTYNEPTIQFEFAYDVCREAKNHNLKTAFVSNGYINRKPVDKIQPYLDAINIDIKSFSDEFYKKICGARLQPVLDSVKYYHKKGVWVEITTLVIPQENDSLQELNSIAEFIASIDNDMPWHVTRFHPDYKMRDKNSTSGTILHKAYDIGKKAGLKYVYVGNVVGDDKENTFCPKCNKLLVKRYGFDVLENNITGNMCKFCKQVIAGVF